MRGDESNKNCLMFAHFKTPRPLSSKGFKTLIEPRNRFFCS